MSRSEQDFEPTTGGLTQEAPRSVLRSLIRLAAVLAFLVVGGSLLVLLGGRLPNGTDATSLIVRGLVGLTIGLLLVMVVRRSLGALAEAPPAPAQKVDARASEVVYECPICGTRVRLEVAVTAKAPKHCGEEMEASLG